MATFPVKYIHNNMRGAPQVSGTPGTLVAALRACLITGFGLVAASSVTVAGGIATAALPMGQSFDLYCVVLIEGATPAELNGEQRVLTASSTSITWATTAPDGLATGSIKIKVAPVGQWEELFAGTVANKAVFRSTDVQGSRFCLWVDDSGTTAARVRGYESMSDVNTGSGSFPTDVQQSGGGYWPKSSAANSNAVRWDFAGDSRAIKVSIAAWSGSNALSVGSCLRGVGDCVNLGPSDAYAVILNCHDTAALNTTSPISGSLFQTGQSAGGATYAARSFSQIGASVKTDVRMYSVGAGNKFTGADDVLGTFPSRVDGELKFSRCYIRDSLTADMTPRADVCGVLYVPQTGLFGSFSARDTVMGSGPLEGRVLVAMQECAAAAVPSASNSGVYFLDITGPWR